MLGDMMARRKNGKVQILHHQGTSTIKGLLGRWMLFLPAAGRQSRFSRRRTPFPKKYIT